MDEFRPVHTIVVAQAEGEAISFRFRYRDWTFHVVRQDQVWRLGSAVNGKGDRFALRPPEAFDSNSVENVVRRFVFFVDRRGL